MASSPALKSGVWEYFSKDTTTQMAECHLCNAKLKASGGSTKSLHTQCSTKDTTTQMAECHLCNAKLKASGGSTKSLHTHLQAKHIISVLKHASPPPEGQVGNDNESTKSTLYQLRPVVLQLQ